MGQLADWKCHKIVKAGKVLAAPIPGDLEVTVEGADGVECEVAVQRNAFARGIPAIGNYIVVYEDGYVSWSPAKAFEEGYTRQNA